MTDRNYKHVTREEQYSFVDRHDNMYVVSFDKITQYALFVVYMMYVCCINTICSIYVIMCCVDGLVFSQAHQAYIWVHIKVLDAHSYIKH